MNFYCYIPRPDGTAPIGTEKQWIIRDLKTLRGAINRIKSNVNWKNQPFVIQTFSNFYDESTFKTVYTHSN